MSVQNFWTCFDTLPVLYLVPSTSYVKIDVLYLIGYVVVTSVE